MRFLLLLCLYGQIAMACANVMLVDTYKNQDLQGWVMSEKLDGIRGYWNGTTLLTRHNTPLQPPHYFTQHFPPFPIDGELFNQRNQFEEISSIVRSQQDKGWHKLKLHVFDVPTAQGNLFQRLQILRDYLANNPSPYITIIEQIPIQNKEQVTQFLQTVERQQGEGIIVRNPYAPYEIGRSSNILKLKSAFDEECTVIAHHQGKGQFKNALGALTCENHRGQFKIGSGFKLKDRINPPPIGSTITYKYRSLTNAGKPRFATFWRERKNE